MQKVHTPCCDGWGLIRVYYIMVNRHLSYIIHVFIAIIFHVYSFTTSDIISMQSVDKNMGKMILTYTIQIRVKAYHTYICRV